MRAEHAPRLRSTPVSDRALRSTEHLIRDIEALRWHLGVDQWLVSGSWGSTLALAYAQRFPSHVSALVLNGVTTSRRSERKWLYAELARFVPVAWERFRGHVPEAVRDEDVIAAYAQRMEDVDAERRLVTAREWCAWEDAVPSLEPRSEASLASQMPRQDLLAFVRICAHCLRHGAWLEEGALIRDAARLAGIPGVLIHGRRDMSCPVGTAWALARAWRRSARGRGRRGPPPQRFKARSVARALNELARQ
jgi:proline iminopeptidase